MGGTFTVSSFDIVLLPLASVKFSMKSVLPDTLMSSRWTVASPLAIFPMLSVTVM